MFYKTIRKFESFDNFLRISALITERYDAAIRDKYEDVGADVHSIEDILQGPAQNWSDLNNESIDRQNISFSWNYKLRQPGPVMFIGWQAYGTYLYQFQQHGAGEEETKLLYDTAVAVFEEHNIGEVKKE